MTELKFPTSPVGQRQNQKQIKQINVVFLRSLDSVIRFLPATLARESFVL